MHAEAASLVVHQIGLIRTISVSIPCLVGTYLDELVVTLPVAVHMNMNTKTEDIQRWRKMILILSLCYNACVILLGPTCHLPILISETMPHTKSPHTSPRQQITTVWELPQATLHNAEKHGSWNLELLNLAGWQQPALKHPFIHEGGLRFMVLHDWEHRW